MKVIRIEANGGPDVIALTDIAEREPGLGEVLVRNHAIGVNFIDVYHRTGLYKNALPTGLGLEAAGIVEAIGDGVTRFGVGDRIVYANGPIGAYAEVHVVKQTQAVKLPDAIPFDIAAASLLKGMTARFLLRKTFRVERGHFVVIHAAAGGVGQIAVQWAKHLGANVIAVVGNHAKAKIVRGLGADHTIIPGRDDIAARVREITGVGAHVVYDSVGKDTFLASLDSLRSLGMMVSFGNASGPPEAIAPSALQQRGSLFLTRPTLFHYTATVEQLDETAGDLFDVIASGAVTIAPPTRYALADAAQAHRDLEARKTTGSLVLIP
ncbi:quinone oxidoreductase [Terricaulis sp.]|uniref:quinone oxidoreductase family protein n=1 Tax=Terricaulis sp. TaxID=2768686 RepID=UPI002AC4A334|nr:quinone oxidoreductase [Terricaulis sp.]MDZ4689917.1 quinone oxidoreductase [Terricaulis sp.]